MAKKVYTLVKYEVRKGCDALDVLMVSTDRKKILNKFRREVAKDKKSNPLWEKYKSMNIFDDEDDYYCVWDFEGHRAMYQTVIVVKCNNLIEKKEKRSKDEGELCPCCHESVLGPDGECSYCGYGRK